MSETPLSPPPAPGGEPSIHMSSAEIIPLYRIQAEIAVQRKWIAAADVPRAESLFTEWRSRGRRIDLAEAIAEIASLSQGNLEDLRKLALVESLRIAPRASAEAAAAAGTAPARPPSASPTAVRIRQVAIAAAILAAGIAAGLLLRSGGGEEGGTAELADAGSRDGVTGDTDSGKGFPSVPSPGPRTEPAGTNPARTEPARQDPPKTDPAKHDPPKTEPEPMPAPPPGADQKELQEWLLSLPDRQLARIVGTPLVDETISQILSGGDPVEVDQFLARFNDRLRQVQDLDRRPR
ncbi:MAG: hypothetical protein HY720_26390 [Planctomycetes bacterium]|nr:hypothetical protein [Planctomycetota bacterium]